ncbi:DUF4312 family protein [Gottfriedia luciferensis]|uniref:DUF4312 family protein n=1 Tax=Gottfriedia luciferensis TaxID=178774 RepID=UPI000B439E4F|nr:DUF4312 family protein [Gottfriedia luciferensis]
MEKTLKQTVCVEGVGNTKEQAISIALGNIQKKILSEQKGMIIRIEPLHVEVIEAKELTYTERFLFIFFPRKRQKYKVVLDVDVNLFILEVDKIQFEQVEQSNSVMNSILGGQQSMR